MMEKKKIFHVHSDPKFIHSTKIFEGSYFDNTVIVLENDFSKRPQLSNKLLFFNDNEVDKIVEICKEADLVVLYDLNLTKSRIALALPIYTKIAWRFFGYELYGKKKKLVLSDKTLKYLKRRKTFKDLLRSIYNRIKYCNKDNALKIFYKAISRINFMLVLSKEEYDFLNTHWKPLPEFIGLPHRWRDKKDFPNLEIKKNNDKRNVIIGNNRGFFNNHLDIIDVIDQYSDGTRGYLFEILFNYGIQNAYTDRVKRAVEGKPYYELIEDFIPKEQFDLFYKGISALVINGYRQMAGANIFLALQNGAKVYLNKGNAHYKWLVNEGLIIFTMEDFKQDLKENNLYLLPEEAKESFERYKEFSERYNKLDFQKALYKKLI